MSAAVAGRPGTVHAVLRAATADAHAALEAELDLRAMLCTRADVGAVLARFYGFFGPLEASLDGLVGAEVMRGRHRVPALWADLEALGMARAAIAALPACAAAGAIASASEAWGALYVVEGARLGGRIIARDLAARGVAHGMRFWTDAQPIASSWPDFLRALDTVPDPAAAARGAQATFARLQAWMAVPRSVSG